jgi:gluconokinase
MAADRRPEGSDVPPPIDQVQLASRAVIVMGASGSGKSTLGPRLAQALQCGFLEGDAFHDAGAVEKMRAGEPLQDEDRWSWLDRIGVEMNATVARDGVGVAACSALKRRYRERLQATIQAPAAFVFLDAGEAELTCRLKARSGHYMPPSLLASQLHALEPPGRDEPALVLDARRPLGELCDSALAWLNKKPLA